LLFVDPATPPASRPASRRWGRLNGFVTGVILDIESVRRPPQTRRPVVTAPPPAKATGSADPSPTGMTPDGFYDRSKAQNIFTYWPPGPVKARAVLTQNN